MSKRGRRVYPEKDYTKDALRDLQCAQQNDLLVALNCDHGERERIGQIARYQREWATAYLNRRQELTGMEL